MDSALIAPGWWRFRAYLNRYPLRFRSSENVLQARRTMILDIDDQELEGVERNWNMDRDLHYDLHESITKHLSHLRAFALLLARDRALADDLVQEAVVRALSHSHQFQPGTNFKAWISTILRNCYFNEIRYRNRITQIAAAPQFDEPTVSGGQEEGLDLRDFNRAFHALTPTQREALVLVGASGFSYEEAAKIAGCALGTMKSRVSRARIELHDMLNGEAPLPPASMESAYSRTDSQTALAAALENVRRTERNLLRSGADR